MVERMSRFGFFLENDPLDAVELWRKEFYTYKWRDEGASHS